MSRTAAAILAAAVGIAYREAQARERRIVLELGALVLTAAVPTGVNAWLIAAQFRTAESLAATTITMTTAAGVVSVMFWAWLMG